MSRALIDRNIFFDNPDIAGGQLSPDGTMITFMKAYNGIMNLWVKAFEAPFDQAKVITTSKSPILGFFWTYDSKYVIFANDNNGDENLNIFSVDPKVDNPVSDNLTPLKEVTARIYKVSKKDPNKIWLGLNDRDKAWHDLYELDIRNKALKLIFKNDQRVTGWNFDWNEKIRLAYRTDENGFSEILRVGDYFDSFELIYTTNLQEGAQVLGWTPDNRYAYLETNKGDINFSTLFKFDPRTMEKTIMESDPLNKVDFGGLMVHKTTKEILGTSYVDEKVRRYWKNKEWKSMFEKFESRFPDREVSISSSTKNYEKFLLSVSGDRYASEVWSYDKETEQFTYQYVTRKSLKAVESRLSPMKPIQYSSSDGLEIPSYLTLPISAASNKNLPLVVLVHGGPKGPRDYWGYNGLVQFLADRGYAVLQPNFRASGGYGKSFLNAGDKQWGRLMQDDITYGVKHLVETGTVDGNRVAIMGGSYGGYATLAGLAFTPDLYSCGVDIVGPSNLFTLLESIPPYWEAGRKWLYEMTGDPETEEGQALLKASSPLFSSDKIKKPLLIVQGANDPRVKKAESDQIAQALSSKGQSVSYLLAEDEGHGFRKPLNKLALYAEVERFFAEHLGGDYQSDMEDDVRSTLAKLTVDI